MKLLRHGPSGSEKPGLLHSDGTIRDLSAVVADIGGMVLSDAGLAAIRAADPAKLPVVAAGTRLGPCVTGTGKFICIGLNYADHAAESGMQVPPEPVIFMKATSAIVGPNDPIIIPRGSLKTDWEVELAVIIGTRGKYIAEADAMDHVAGYCCANDATIRDWQRHTAQFTPGKNFPRTGGLGPWLVTRDTIEDLDSVTLTTRLNGVVMQHASLAQLIFPIPTIIAYLSTFTTLAVGDVIMTGTPGGVGARREPPVYMAPGDIVEVEISGVGLLSNRIGAE